MTTLREAAQQALEALEYEHRSPRGYGYELSVYEMRETSAAITALRAALAQQAEPVDTDCHTQGICQRSGYGIGKQAEPVEPVAEARYDGTLRWLEPHGVGLHRIQGPLYTAPPPCPTCQSLARTVMMDQMGKA